MTDGPNAARAVLDFWFDEVGEDRWFAKDEALDAVIEQRFGHLREQVVANSANGWRHTPGHLLAAIILIDQFGRNIHRGSAKAFASLAEFAKLGDAEVLAFARLHHDQIARFGRFPGRNTALGRVSSADEQAVIDGGTF